MRRFLLAWAVLLLFAPPAFAKFDPSYSWTTLETPHFLIHYHQGGEEAARKAAGIAEDVHARLVPRIKWEPKQKTRLVLVDAMDEANGMAFPIPYNQMVIFLTHPAGSPGFGSIACDDWLRLVITHEYAHILQLDMVNGGLGGVMQTLFGRIYFPNMFQPVWMIEGLATYEETEQTGGGRGRSPAADMVLRMAALEGPFPSLDQASVFLDSWPGGQTPYLFGESFTRYIAEKYGREKLAEISIAYSGRGLPFLVDSTGRRVLHRSYANLWSDWQQRLTQRYARIRDDVRAEGMTATSARTTRGYYNVFPSFSPDGMRIAYVVRNADEFPGIHVMNSDGSGDRRLLDSAALVSTSGAGPSWSPDGGRIYYSRAEIRRNTQYESDIYYYDLAKGKERRLTKGLRSRDPRLSPDGTRIVFVQNRLGRTRLATAPLPPGRKHRTLREEEITPLTEWSETQFSGPAFSPDGQQVAVSAGQPGGNRDIWVLDAAGRPRRELGRDRAVDTAPVWSPDGRYVYFSSDRTGIFNLYAWEVETGKLLQATNVLGGAFTPTVSPDGTQAAFSSYSAKGYDIHVLPLDASQWKEAKPYRDPYPVPEYADAPVETATRPYSPLSTIYPRFWIPWFGYSSESKWLFGAFTFGQDSVQRHQYFASALYGPSRSRKWFSFDYLYDGFYPTVHLSASDRDITHSDLPSSAVAFFDYTERQKTYGLSFIIPLLRTRFQHSLTLGYRWRELSALTPLTAFSTDLQPAEGILASGRAVYQYNNAQRYGFSISPEDGRTVELGYERLDRSLGSDYELHKYTADWHEYIGFPWKHHVLQVRAFAGSSTGDDIPQRAFQLGGDTLGDITLSIDGQSVHLRGYPLNTFRGRKAALGSLEYRFPITNVEEGWDSKALFLRRLHGAVFFEAGNAWDDVFHGSDLKRSVGIEARLDTYLAYYLPVTFRLVVAAGLDEEGEEGLYFGLWIPLAP